MSDFQQAVKDKLVELGYTLPIEEDTIEVLDQLGVTVSDAVEYFMSGDPLWFDE